MVPLEDKAQGSVTFRTYYKFFIAGGGYVVNLILVIAFLMTEVRGIDCSLLLSLCEMCLVCVVCSVVQASIVVSDWFLSEW